MLVTPLPHAKMECLKTAAATTATAAAATAAAVTTAAAAAGEAAEAAEAAEVSAIAISLVQSITTDRRRRAAVNQLMASEVRISDPRKVLSLSVCLILRSPPPIYISLCPCLPLSSRTIWSDRTRPDETTRS